MSGGPTRSLITADSSLADAAKALKGIKVRAL